jgi:hypothetical protein
VRAAQLLAKESVINMSEAQLKVKEARKIDLDEEACNIDLDGHLNPLHAEDLSSDSNGSSDSHFEHGFTFSIYMLEIGWQVSMPLGLPLYLAIRGAKAAKNQLLFGYCSADPRKLFGTLNQLIASGISAWICFVLYFFVPDDDGAMQLQLLRCFAVMVLHKACVALKYSWLDYEEYQRILFGTFENALAWNMSQQFVSGWIHLTHDNVEALLDQSAKEALVNLDMPVHLPTDPAQLQQWRTWLDACRDWKRGSIRAGTQEGPPVITLKQLLLALIHKADSTSNRGYVFMRALHTPMVLLNIVITVLHQRVCGDESTTFGAWRAVVQVLAALATAFYMTVLLKFIFVDAILYDRQYHVSNTMLQITRCHPPPTLHILPHPLHILPHPPHSSPHTHHPPPSLLSNHQSHAPRSDHPHLAHALCGER